MNQEWTPSNESRKLIRKLNRNASKRFLEIGFVFVILAVMLVVPNSVSIFSRQSVPVFLMISGVFVFFYWYFGSNVFLPRKFSLRITPTPRLYADGWFTDEIRYIVIHTFEFDTVIKFNSGLIKYACIPNDLMPLFAANYHNQEI